MRVFFYAKMIKEGQKKQHDRPEDSIREYQAMIF